LDVFRQVLPLVGRHQVHGEVLTQGDGTAWRRTDMPEGAGHRPGVIEWDGLLLDGWRPILA